MYNIAMKGDNIMQRSKNHNSISLLTILLIIAISAASPLSSRAAEAGTTQAAAEAETKEPFRYQHDPMENPNAAKDIIVNPDAVYGYSPSPDSVRLKEYADAIDWTDEEQVAAAREQRAAYHESFKGLYRLIEDMLGEGKNIEEIARAASAKRNEIRLAAYDGNPEGLEKAKKSNLDTYGHEEGPTPDQLYEKYGSWQTVLEKSLSSNPGMDACLGFYDEYFDTYDIPARISASNDAAVKDSAGSEATSSDESDGAGQDVNTAANSDAAGTAKTYTVKKGDCLWSIAASELGDGSRWPEIYERNKAKISNPRLIYAGQELALPAA